MLSTLMVKQLFLFNNRGDRHYNKSLKDNEALQPFSFST